jgi:hypothetical protein
MKWALGMECPSLMRLRGGGFGWGGAQLLETLEDMLRRAPDTGFSFHRGPFMSEANLVFGGALIYRGI